MNFTTEQIQKGNIAIAEFCGWKWNGPEGPAFKHLTYWTPPWANGRLNDKHISELPNYYSSLDAMHKAEKLLIQNGYAFKYLENIGKVCKTELEDDGYLEAIVATAPQRFEALLRTIGKYDEVMK